MEALLVPKYPDAQTLSYVPTQQENLTKGRFAQKSNLRSCLVNTSNDSSSADINVKRSVYIMRVHRNASAMTIKNFDLFTYIVCIDVSVYVKCCA